MPVSKLKKKYEEKKSVFCSLKVTEERSRIRSRNRSRIRIHYSEVRIWGSGSVPKCQGSPTLLYNVYYSSSSLPNGGRFIDWAFNVKLYENAYCVGLGHIKNYHLLGVYFISCSECREMFLCNHILFQSRLRGKLTHNVGGGWHIWVIRYVTVYLIFIYHFVRAFRNYFCRSYLLVWNS